MSALFKEKINRFDRLVAEQEPKAGVLKYFAVFRDPPLLNLVRRIGIETKPLFYWHPAARFLFIFLQLGLLLSIMIWVLFRNDPKPLSLESSLMFGYSFAFLGQLIGIPIDHVAKRKYQVPEWKDL